MASRLVIVARAGFDVNARPRTAPLHEAAMRGSLPIIRLLLDHGADPNVHDTGYDATPAGWAEHHGQAEAQQLLDALERPNIAIAAHGAPPPQATSGSGMTPASIELRPLISADLPVIAPWFEDPDTRRFLGGPDWPAAMLAHSERSVGTTFRGAVQTGAYHYLALADGSPVGYIDCGTFDRCTVYAGEGPGGPIITEAIDAPTGSIAFATDPARRAHGLGRAMIAALLDRPELQAVNVFEAGVEPENIASRRCLEAVGFQPLSEEPDFEGMLYYRAWREDFDGHSGASG